ncbi:hypothetical protein PRUPE_8G012000 [Prunus persica]|uniref:AAA+ ATPase domain-containing protein n=1 Tax=Prunus persica TaxID=3760 RepID=A0A251MR05_PRUPE|nr:hypothetical protein PRUPE_8G012000 [Prunus persica]
MEFKRLKPATYLVYRCQPIGRLKRLERNFELLIQITECLYSMRDTINEEVTKELMWGKAPTLKCKKWLEKVGEIEDQVNDMLKIQETSSDLVIHSHVGLHQHLMSMLNKITDHLEKSPGAHGSMAYVPPGQSKTVTSPILHGEAYGLVPPDNKNVNLQRRAEAKGEANVEIEMSPTQGKEAVKGKEIQEGNPQTENKRLQAGAILKKDFKKSSKTINQIEVDNNIPLQNDGREALLEWGVHSISIERMLHEILGCMNSVTIGRIAIYGMGGIGKTTVLKALANHVERKSTFDKVILVTVSKHWSTRKIQNEILRQLSMCVPDSETDSRVAEKLLQVLNSRKFLLLLDDVWECLDLKAVGIPDLSSENGFKMILATRIRAVCIEMVVNRVIEMETLSREEAWELFCEQVGAVVHFPSVQPYARAIVEECGGLPLLIIVTGRALTGVNDALVWKHALSELLLPSTNAVYDTEAVMQRMKFSYDRLRDCDIKSCFLYCAFLSEDQEVNIYELVKYYIQEGLISGNWDDACKRGHEIVDILVGASLLQSTKGGLSIKMHAMVRDLASMIILSKAERCQFLSKSGAGLRESLPVEKWEQAKMIALMDNELSSLPENPCCPDLLILFLQRNRCLRVIPAAFFDRMPSLEVLNLSNTRIKFLPQSISNLKRLKILILRSCERLVVLPSEVGSLGDLEVLDLRGTEVDKLPDEIGSLTSLRHLEVSFYGSISPSEYAKLPHQLISPGIISKLISLETLSIDVYPGDQRWKKSLESITREVCSLTKLTSLCFSFPEVELLQLFIQTCTRWKNQLLTMFKFVVGDDVKRIVSRVPNFVVHDYNQQGQCLRFVNGEKVPDVVVEVLARAVAFYLDHHLSIRSLSEFGVSNMSRLKLCILSECPQIHSIIDCTEPTNHAFPSLEYLSVHYLPNLENIWEGVRPLPFGSFTKLRILLVYACPKLKNVFTTSMLSCVSNLEELLVEDCPAIEVITLEDESMDSGTVRLLRLKRLTLNHLPRLANISEGAWPSLEYISLYGCPNWKTIAMNSKVEVNCKED